jgi:Recombination endonuclease VII
MKICRKCKGEKALSEFHKRIGAKDGVHPVCKECRKQEPRPSLDMRRAYLRRKNYGLTDADFWAMFESQSGVCAICMDPLTLDYQTGLHIDHDHKTGKVRGLLCGRCNAGLGHFRDRIDLCLAAHKYLISASILVKQQSGIAKPDSK